MNHTAEKALLPAGMIDLLPPDAMFEASSVERLIACFGTYGYERVKPPIVEFEDTLLASGGAALAEKTFRLMDPISHRMLGLRADMTMQVARIATTRLAARPRPLRLSYGGQVVRVSGSQLRPERQVGQVGAELIGSAAPAADTEVMVMAATSLDRLGVDKLTIDIGIPTLVPALIIGLGLDADTRARLRGTLDQKDIAGIAALAPDIGDETAAVLAALVELTGPVAPALDALTRLDLPPPASEARSDLTAVIDGLRAAAPDLHLSVDAVENRGFEYHTGVTFTIFARDAKEELGRGGRYVAGIGLGLAEPSTGVTLFMDSVLRALPGGEPAARVFLPPGTAAEDAAALRDQGWIAIDGFGATGDPEAEAVRLLCSHIFINGEVHALRPHKGQE